MTTSRRVVHYSFQDCTKFGSSTSILSLLPTSILLLPRQLSSAYPSLVVTRYKTKETSPVSSLRVAAAAAAAAAAAENDDTQIRVHRSEEGEKVWHMGGSAGQKSERRDDNGIRIKKFTAHKNQWIEETGKEWPSSCSTKDCNNEAAVGAHVVLESKEMVHLVPMCQSCNCTRVHNWIPEYDENNRTGLELDVGTPCLELNHISKHESRTITEVVPWIDMYDKLKIHYAETKTTLGPYMDDELKRWVSNQRTRYKNKVHQMPPDQVTLLEAINFEWYLLDAQWAEYFALLVIFAKREKHCNVPQLHQEDGMKLGKWVSNQRETRKNAKLDPDREKRLDELGVEWDANIARWIDMYDKLKIHYAETKTTLGPYMDDELKRWVSNQRTRYKNKVHQMPPDQVTLLEAINFEWYLLDAQWAEYFALLVIFAKREKHCNVPQLHQEDGMKLGKWVSNQRETRKNAKLDPDREKRLDELGVEWDANIARWEENFASLVQFKMREGHCNVPRDHEEDAIKLGEWLNNQRRFKREEGLDPDRERRLNKTLYRKGGLKNDRQQKLEKIGVVWNPKQVVR